MSDSEKQHPVPHCLIFDPVPFNGGSKVASYEMVRQSMQAGVRFTVLTCDIASWQAARLDNNVRLQLTAFKAPGRLTRITSGWLFWLKQGYFLLILMWALLRQHKITMLAGISGPGVDMALYLCRLFFKRPITQFIHGPVSTSRSVGYCLTRADKVFYLQSCYPSMCQALERFYSNRVNQDAAEALARFTIHAPHYFSFTNGLGRRDWPTQCQHVRPRLFWAASLLKWKGLDTLTDALQLLPEQTDLRSEICYIRPHNIALPQSDAPQNVRGVKWRCQPDNLDQVRASCNIFVSTSSKEPFGLSILESLAAGLCVVIPQDSAYWDQQLIHNVNCIKYTPGSALSLADAIQSLLEHPARIRRIGTAGSFYAEHYRAESCYQQIVAVLAAPNASRQPSATGHSYA